VKLGFEKALLLSLALHGLAYGAGLGWMAWRERADESMDIDLSRSTLIPMLANLQGNRAPKPEEDWVMDNGRKLAPMQVKPASPTAQAEEEPAGPPVRCPGCGGRVYPPCRLCRMRRIKEEEQRKSPQLRRRLRPDVSAA